MSQEVLEKIAGARPVAKIDPAKRYCLHWYVAETGLDHKSELYLPGKEAAAHFQKTCAEYERDRKRFHYLSVEHYLEDEEGNLYK